MNAQVKYAKDGTLISRGIEWTHAPFGVGTGYTANPVRGCEHGCRWQMPDGKWVDCYAETQRDRMDGKGSFKNITFHPDVFTGIHAKRTPCGIFIDSMSDLCGEGVKEEWIHQVIGTMHQCQQHIFFVLTKNPRRLTEFEWPNNAMVGISAPPTFMYGKEMNLSQQQRWFSRGMEWLYDCKAKRKWVSLEPMSVDITEWLEYRGSLDWAVIGAGSDGRKYFQPDESLFSKTIHTLTCPRFYKGNLDRALAERHGGWREDFPQL